MSKLAIPDIDETAVTANLPSLRAIAEELFLGPVEIGVEEDPEISNRRQIVFDVQARGSVEEISQRRIEWYRWTMAILGDNCDKVRLSISVEEP